ncbi:MAG: hypothetical protein J0L93_10585 [Deltaproteobacteria bacterium]|nr:hypothetical protein [Deltaproteobacteria bacterium]
MKRVGWIFFSLLLATPIFAQDFVDPFASPTPSSDSVAPAMPPMPSMEGPSEAPTPSPSSAPKSNVKKKVVYKEKSYYDFEDVLINGNLRKPDGSFIFRKNQTNFSSALNLKRSFIPELKESATNAR